MDGNSSFEILKNEQNSTPTKKIFKIGNSNFGFSKRNFLGSGNFADVFLGRNTVTNTPVAVKRIKKNKIMGEQKLIECLKVEMKTMRRQDIDHSHLVTLHHFEETSKYYYLVIEYCESDLGKIIKQKQEEIASLPLSKLSFKYKQQQYDYLKQNSFSLESVIPVDVIGKFLVHLTLGLIALHSRSLLHRDLKPENLLLTVNPLKSNSENWEECILKIADFGFTREIDQGELAKTLCGTPLYMAPEVISGMPYSTSADIWSMGCIIYEMFTGRPPFLAQSAVQLANIIRTQGVFYPPYIPEEARQLIYQLLRKSPNHRFTLDLIKQHPFFLKYFEKYNSKKMTSSLPISSNKLPKKKLPMKPTKSQQIPDNSEKKIKNLPSIPTNGKKLPPPPNFQSKQPPPLPKRTSSIGGPPSPILQSNFPNATLMRTRTNSQANNEKISEQKRKLKEMMFSPSFSKPKFS